MAKPIAVVKAQIHAGGRGKGTVAEVPAQRGVQLVRNRDEAEEVAANLLGHRLITVRPGPKAARCIAFWWKRAVRSRGSFTSAWSSTGGRPGQC